MENNVITQSIRKCIGKSQVNSCSIISGYIAGWIQALVKKDMTIMATEIKCRGKGNDICHFVVGSTKHVHEYLSNQPNKSSKVNNSTVSNYGSYFSYLHEQQSNNNGPNFISLLIDFNLCVDSFGKLSNKLSKSLKKVPNNVENLVIFENQILSNLLKGLFRTQI